MTGSRKAVREGRRASRLLALWAAVSLLALGLAAAPAPARAAAAPVVTPDTALQQLWRSYGDSGRGWSGADSTYSVPLPGGEDAWLFSDTFLGPVAADGSRPQNAPFIHNSIVLQRGAELTTLTGGTPSDPQSLVGPTPPGPPTDPANVNPYWYWSGDGIVEGDQLRVFYLRFISTGTGAFDFQWQSDAIATFQLPSMRLVALTPTYGAGGVTWGSWLMNAGAYTYIYGVEDLGSVKYLHLARAPRGQLLGAWQFDTGGGWSSDPSASARLLSGVSTEFSVTREGGRYVLVTFDTSIPFGNEIVTYDAAAPEGPFTGPADLYATPESGGNIITYNAHAHPELSRPGHLVISYNVNSLVVADVYRNVDDYRARFVVADLEG